MKKCYLISYDISDEKRLRKMAKLLEEYGYRVQKSVFVCFLTEFMYETLRQKIKLLIDLHQDRVRIYQLCRSCQKTAEVEGITEVPQEEDFVIV